MRIIAGKYKGRTLYAPDSNATRPTSDRARESIFNIIQSRLTKENRSFQELTVLDAFAGTGALGIEAVSRGSKEAFFMENAPQTLEFLRKNTMLVAPDLLTLKIFNDALNPPKAPAPVGIAFLDPPYEKQLVPKALEVLKNQGWIDAKTLCVIETSIFESDFLTADFQQIDSRTYGKAKVTFACLV